MLIFINIVIMVGVLVVWVVFYYFGVGFVVDVILLIGGVVLFGW